MSMKIKSASDSEMSKKGSHVYVEIKPTTQRNHTKAGVLREGKGKCVVYIVK